MKGSFQHHKKREWTSVYHLYPLVWIALSCHCGDQPQLMAVTDFAQKIVMWEEEVLCVGWHCREKQEGKFEQKK